jgi:hypothetical protein
LALGEPYFISGIGFIEYKVFILTSEESKSSSTDALE